MILSWGDVMDIELFFNRIYTVAFRLTGEEEIAEEIASQAITHTIKDLNEYYKSTSNMFQLTILELAKIFLTMPNLHYNENLNGIKKALLKLKPVSRVVVIWKDVLGYQISDNIPISDCTYEELMKELICGRKELKEYISNLKYAEKI